MKRLLLALCCAVSSVAIADTPAPTALVAARGGAVGKPVALDDLVYLSTGGTITVWRRGAGGALDPVSDTRRSPLPGGITSLQRQGDYLFASFGAYTTGGVAVLSIADRTRPVVLATFEYSHNPYRRPAQLLVVGSQLYLFDEETGFYASSLSDPLNLQFRWLGLYQWVNDRYDVVGNRVYNSGMGETSGSVLGAWDVTNPATPAAVGYAHFSCCDLIGMRMRGDYAYSFGEVFSVLDVTQVSNPVVVAELPAVGWGGFNAVLLDHHAWSVQRNAIAVIDITNPLQPVYRGSHAFTAPEDLYFAERAGDSVLVAERSNRLQRLAVDAPESPTVTAQHWLPGSAQPWAAVMHGNRLLTAEFNGIGILDASSLERLDYQQIPFNGFGRGGVDVVAEGDRAYIKHVRNGFSVVDISNPDSLQALGSWLADLSALTVSKGVVYASHWGGVAPRYNLSAVDMTVPQNPVVLSSIAMPEATAMAIRDHRLIAGHVYGAAGSELRILDISNPASPLQLGYYGGCPARYLAANPRGTVVFLSCGNRLEIVDVGNPAQPVLLHRRDAISWTGAVEFHDNRIYLSQDNKLVELDVTDPANPVLLRESTHAGIGKFHVGRDARLYAVSVGIQVHAFDRLFHDGLER